MFNKVVLFLTLLLFLTLNVEYVSAESHNYGWKKGDHVSINDHVFLVVDTDTLLLLSKNILPNRIFDNAGYITFNPTRVSNIAYFLNNNFINELSGFEEYIKTANFGGVEAKVGLLSESIYLSLRGNVLPQNGEDRRYFLIDQASTSNGTIKGVDPSGRISIVFGYNPSGIRPVIYFNYDQDLAGKMLGTGEVHNPYKFATEVFEEVENVRGVTYYNRIYLEWDNPEHDDLKKILIYKDNHLIEEVLAPLNYRDIRSLEPETEYTFVLKSYYDPPGEVTQGVSFTATTKAVTELINITTITPNYHSAEINFYNPNQKAALYEGNKKITETTDDKFLLDKLEAGKKYDFVVKSITEDGYTSKGFPVSFTLPNAPQLEEISEVKANATYERVDLSWQNPIYNPNFNFVRIYRKELTKQTSFINKMLFGSEVKANTGYAPLFETNGTYFNDLTVEPETKYEYKLTTENKSGFESEGVTIQVTTLEAPPPSMGGVTGEENENGDYVYKWTSPTTGKVKILVGGKEYAIVPASDGEITIPKKDMKYTLLGSPDVKLVAISESGKEGKPTNPGSIIGTEKIGFSANDLLKTSMSLLFIVGPFLLLALAFIFVPRIIELLRQAAKKRNALARRERT